MQRMMTNCKNMYLMRMPEHIAHFSIIGKVRRIKIGKRLSTRRKKIGAPVTQGWYVRVQGEMEGFRFDRKLVGASESFFHQYSSAVVKYAKEKGPTSKIDLTQVLSNEPSD